MEALKIEQVPSFNNINISIGTYNTGLQERMIVGIKQHEVSGK